MADLPLWIAIGLTLTAGAWFLAARRNRLAEMPIGSGLVRGLLIAIPVGVVGGLSLPSALHLGFPVDIGLGGFVIIGLLFFGIPIALGFFWAGALLMPLGLLVTANRAWPTVGTWVAAVVAGLLVVVGYGGYQAVKAAIDAPATGTGTAVIDIAGTVTPRATGSGQATCTLYDDGTFRVDVGIGFSRTPPMMTGDGREVTIQLVWPADRAATVALEIGDRASMMAQDGVMTIRQGSTPSAGTMDVQGILPSVDGNLDRTDPWSGTVSWECPLG